MKGFFSQVYPPSTDNMKTVAIVVKKWLILPSKDNSQGVVVVRVFEGPG